MAMTVGASSVLVTSGRGKAKVSIEVDFSSIEKWAKKMKVDEEKLMKQSFGIACSGLKAKFRQVVTKAGGVAGVPKFKDFEEFTNELRIVQGIQNRPMGGVLAEKSSIVSYKENGWQIIGWHNSLAEPARRFQDADPYDAETKMNDNTWRSYLHRSGIKDIPRTYTQNLRRIIPEPFGTYVQQHLEEWAQAIYWKKLVSLVKKNGDLAL